MLSFQLHMVMSTSPAKATNDMNFRFPLSDLLPRFFACTQNILCIETHGEASRPSVEPLLGHLHQRFLLFAVQELDSS